MNSALERLRSLRAGSAAPIHPTEHVDGLGLDHLAIMKVSDLPEPWRELYEERAAIREFDGCQAREHAEAEAFNEILQLMRESAERK